MRKTLTNTLAAVSFVIALAGFSAVALAHAATPGTAESIGHSHGGPSTPSTPSSASSGNTGTEADTAWFDFGNRKTANPGFCDRNANDYYVKSGRAVCVGY